MPLRIGTRHAAKHFKRMVSGLNGDLDDDLGNLPPLHEAEVAVRPLEGGWRGHG